ncbi:acyclic terpene utilization AtuA family protein [Perlucidibaca aquatica]|uniref:acyclic terpene utilization AtuA family protein n=1 Tax=Perlucidibaca aquatica TaxID=1852776 RepID=UPI000839E76B|nr:acyclic terpene utilization AtuA family protein [Perlucidibaca aquatica]
MKSIRIGCASAFWGDTSTAAEQLVQHGKLDYLVFDYLAEVTMSILAVQRMKDPAQGYARDFVDVMTPLLPAVKAQGMKVISNAGGMNVGACRDALQAAAVAAGITLRIAVVEGDDLTARQGEFREAGITEMDTGAAFPGMLVSMNAYLGAPAVAEALRQGADIVITGRGVDSAVALGPMMHEFGWSATDYDKLAQGSLAGHVIECGAQCTGGNFTDWETVSDGYENMGFPFVDIREDGSFLVGKPEGTGGAVTVGTVGEQMLYEIGDPRAYLLPDVRCDFTTATLAQVGPDSVLVQGARGFVPPDTYKVSGTTPRGNRITATFLMGGRDAPAKAARVAQALITKCEKLFEAKGWGPFGETNVELLGAETMYGPNARAGALATREVVVKIAAKHREKAALVLFSKELAQAATGMAPGLTGYFGGRPSVQPVVQLWSCKVPKRDVAITVDFEGVRTPVVVVEGAPFDPAALTPQPVGETWVATADAVNVPLIKLAIARSGDKGDHGNVGVMARDPAYLPYLRAALGEQRVATYFAHLISTTKPVGSVSRWELPGSHSFNFLIRHALGGGGIASLRTDPQGKCFAQMLLDIDIPVPPAVAASLT